jgi:Family of unknown function (DUF6515)
MATEGIPSHEHTMTLRKSLLAPALALLACAGGSALAQDHDRHDHRGSPSHREPGWTGGHGHGDVRFDGRYGHNHYYPSRGYVYGTLPVGAVSVGFGGGSYFFHGGVWYRPYSGRYIVVEPPLGIYLPVLPPDYATVWVGGVPYYYADGVYYNVAPGHGYVVVAPPPGVDTTQTVAPPPPPPVAPDPIFYPRNNQSAAQTEADRRECNSWATTQPNAMADAKVFQRATEACMDGRGYTVR